MSPIHRLKLAQLLLLGAALWLDRVSLGAASILHVDGIQGSSLGVANAYVGDIDIAGYSWVVSRTAINGLPAATNFGDLVITKYVDAASPALAVTNAKSTYIASCVLHININPDLPRNAGDSEIIHLTGVYVDSFLQNSSTLSANSLSQVTETLTLRYDRILPVNATFLPSPPAAAAILLRSAPSNDGTDLVGDFSDEVHQSTPTAPWLSLQNLTFAEQSLTNANQGRSQLAFPDLLFQHTNTPTSEDFLAHLLAGTLYTNVVIDNLAYQQGTNANPIWYHLKIGQVWISAVSEANMVETIRMHIIGPVSWSYSLKQTGPGQNDTFTGSSTGAAPTAFVTVSSMIASPPVATLTWPAVDGATYQIVQASQPGGPFTPYTRVTASSTGAMTYAITNSGLFQFYRVQLPFPK